MRYDVDVNLPFHHDVIELLKQAGWFEVSLDQSCDATFSISASGNPLCANYVPGGTKCTGVVIQATGRFVTDSNVVRFKIDSSGELLPSQNASSQLQGIANEAPFLKAYELFVLPKIVSAFGDSFGPTPIVNVFFEETYNLPEKWTEWKDEDLGLISAAKDAILKCGKPALPTLRQVEQEFRWVNQNNWVLKPNGYKAIVTLDNARSLIKSIELGQKTSMTAK